MKKGQRPSRHIRNIRTKHGRKRILVNKSIKRRSRMTRSERMNDPKNYNRFKEFHFKDLKDLPLGEVERLLKQQVDMNMDKELKELKKYDNEKLIESARAQKKLIREKELENKKTNNQFIKSKEYVEAYETKEESKNAHFFRKKAGELESLKNSLGNIKDIDKKFDFWNKYNLDKKLDNLDNLADNADDKKLKRSATVLRNQYKNLFMIPIESKEIIQKTPFEQRNEILKISKDVNKEVLKERGFSKDKLDEARARLAQLKKMKESW
jgi:hypothetical protein